jgi:hypothetical protein
MPLAVGPVQVTVILFFVLEGDVILKVALDGGSGTARGIGLGLGLGVRCGVAVATAVIGDEGAALTSAGAGAEGLGVIKDVGARVPEPHDAIRRATTAAVTNRWPLTKSLQSPNECAALIKTNHRCCLST